MTKCLILPHQALSKTKKGLSTLRKPRTSSEILQLNIGLPGCLLGKQRPWPQYWSVTQWPPWLAALSRTVPDRTAML